MLTVIRDWGPLVQLPFVGPGVKPAALDVAERRLVRGAGPHAANPEALSLPNAIFATVFWPGVGKEEPAERRHAGGISHLPRAEPSLEEKDSDLGLLNGRGGEGDTAAPPRPLAANPHPAPYRRCCFMLWQGRQNSSKNNLNTNARRSFPSDFDPGAGGGGERGFRFQSRPFARIYLNRRCKRSSPFRSSYLFPEQSCKK